MRDDTRAAPSAPPSTAPHEPPLWRVWDDVRRSAEHLPWRNVAPPTSRGGQFIQGLVLPFQLIRVLLADPVSRRGYLRVCLTQAAVILALAVMFTHSSARVARTAGAEDWAEQKLEEAQAAEHAEAGDQAERALEKAFTTLSGDAEAGAEEKKRAAREVARSLRALKAKQKAEKKSDDDDSLASRFVYWAALLSSLQIAQWVVIALSRDHHTQLSREASLRTGLTPEDEALVPRIRVDLRWMRRQFQKRWRAVWLFAMGMPVLWVFKRLLPEWGEWLFPVMVSAWGAWWFVVFTAGKSALAWNEPEARAPWFLRLWSGGPSRLAPLRAYGAWWTRVTQPVFSPAAAVERAPWGPSGLAVVRALSALPLVKCFLRPVIPVAAAHLLAARPEASAAPSPLSVEPSR